MKTIGLPSALPLTKSAVALLVAGGVLAFHLAFAHWALAGLIVVYLGCLAELTRIRTGRGAFYIGLLFGVAVYAPKLAFFFTLFNVGAILLWLILALWHALFLCGARWARERFGPVAAAVLVAVIWTGVEYFRCELYPLKFSWLAAGYAFAPRPGLLVAALGLYGSGFVLMLLAACYSLKRHSAFVAAAALVVALLQMPAPQGQGSGRALKVAGMQMEFPAELEVPFLLDALVKKHPEAELLVLSEYTFDGPLPPRLRDWCKRNGKYLVVGAKEPLGETNFYNTAFVIGPSGEILHKQVKAVPIQFFKDGLPAPEQTLWNSPWGKIGICICYDLSFSRVTDELVRQGAKLLVVPTMDLVEWGRAQHELHALIAPLRAAEYGVPIVRVASSGISQIVSGKGVVLSSAPFPGENESIAGEVRIGEAARLPWDRYVAPVCSGIAGLVIAMSFLRRRGLRSPINFASVRHPQEVKFATGKVEFVEDSVIANANSESAHPLEPHV